MAANLTRAVAAHVADGLKKVETTDLQQRLEVCSVCELRKDDRCTDLWLLRGRKSVLAIQ